MSSTGPQGGASSSSSAAAAAATRRSYFCHLCKRHVVLEFADINFCPYCLDDFLEEDLLDFYNPTMQDPSFSFPSSSSSSSSMLLPNSDPAHPIQYGFFRDDLNPYPRLARLFKRSITFPPSYSEFTYSSSHCRLLLTVYVPYTAGFSSSFGFQPEDVQHLLPSSSDRVAFTPRSFLQHIVNLLNPIFVPAGLFQNDDGPPPASKSVVDSLPDVKVSKELLLSDDDAQCVVCRNSFEVGADVKQLPCKHIYHKECIISWLELRNSCPVCRFELPTDDPYYENRRWVTQMVNSSRIMTGDRGFVISIPWIPRSSSGEVDNEADSGGRGDQDHGSGTNQQGLD